ncbi:MAG: HPr family phosphocarrier protein [Defluviitaleaceae bacterium]|nr:HPr family phosphocarrier protein [Defluviitaleaceae bacterium]
MTSIMIHLDSVEKVKSFVNIISVFDGEYDLGSDRYVVDAKSIMGIFSLDLSKPLRLDIHDERELEKVQQKLAEFAITNS